MTAAAQTPSETLTLGLYRDWLHEKAATSYFAAYRGDLIAIAYGIERLEREIAAAEQRNFALAAGQCIVDGGLLGDDGGTPYCSVQRELAAAKAQIREVTDYVMGYWPLDWCCSGLIAAINHLVERMQKAEADRDQLRATVARQAEEIERLGKDAERYRWLRDLKCNQLHLTMNGDHAANYCTAKQWIEEFDPDGFTDDPAEEVQRMKDTNTIWGLQVYPYTPVGFWRLNAATLDAAIDTALAKEPRK